MQPWIRIPNETVSTYQRCKFFSFSGRFEISCSSFPKIYWFPERVLLEHIETICCRESKLFFCSICSVWVCSRNRYIVESFCIEFSTLILLTTPFWLMNRHLTHDNHIIVFYLSTADKIEKVGAKFGQDEKVQCKGKYWW